MKSMKPLKQLNLSVPAQETPITSFFTTQTLNRLLPESLYKRISSIGDPSISVVPVLDQWVQKGREIRKQELQDIIRELKNYKQFKHALELSTINSPEVCPALSCLLDFYKVRHLIKVEVRPNLILNAEKEIGIVYEAGGSVSANGRLQGRLEVSRAFGDRQFKKVGVVATPDIHSFSLTERDNFIILGCDGLWGVFGASDAVEFVHNLLKEGLPVAAVTRRLVREAIRERRCKDNCTAIIIVFKNQ